MGVRFKLLGIFCASHAEADAAIKRMRVREIENKKLLFLKRAAASHWCVRLT